ncbi:PQQ-binding-like beta-propeller repeat protein [Frigoriglobus tundricola]|uniref:Pyrrolo-quinoline quinone repeat domain-containing protein n=1 Tax=Frigoriglobus tundricola TaxID=2774151 RepID=A0A6M5YXB2_9BACT|nr:PQQ-binding-like beta-propeller repeat protein [Frigoriglobus tundricola]QJW98094.1 hypothetical protein FTUN_5674 [Frigoriglobus tundricola]
MRHAVWSLLVVAVPVGAAAEPPAWPQYGGTNRNFAGAATGPLPKTTKRLWSIEFGPGTSGIVSDGERLFTHYSVPDPKKSSEGQEVVACLDPKTGKTLWDHRYPVARLKGQESYSGDPIRPQATSAVCGPRLCSLGYTGLLKCFDSASGKILWEYDLVRDFDATPVQFGFSASPLVYGEAFVVHVGGKKAAVVAFNPADGKVLWSSKPAEPSYSSPVVMPATGADVIVQVTRDDVLGLAAKDGRERWRYPLPKTGLTNVPTPIVLPKQRLLISGQGVLGTRLLQVTAAPTGDKVAEVWKNEKVPFFYANWVADERAVFGVSGQFVCGLSLADGKELWRERGQADANFLRIGADALLLRGDGRLSRARLSIDGFDGADGLDLLKGRCWTAPTLLGDVLYARSEKELVAVRFTDGGKD